MKFNLKHFHKQIFSSKNFFLNYICGNDHFKLAAGADSSLVKVVIVNWGRFFINLGNSCYYISKKIATNWGGYYKSLELLQIKVAITNRGSCYKPVHNS